MSCPLMGLRIRRIVLLYFIVISILIMASAMALGWWYVDFRIIQLMLRLLMASMLEKGCSYRGYQYLLPKTSLFRSSSRGSNSPFG
jgi:hypothetical protein